MITVKMSNRGLFVTTVTYQSVHGSRSIILNGGQVLEVENSALSSNPELPDNILNLPVTDSSILKTDFRYDKDSVSIKLTES